LELTIAVILELFPVGVVNQLADVGNKGWQRCAIDIDPLKGFDNNSNEKQVRSDFRKNRKLSGQVVNHQSAKEMQRRRKADALCEMRLEVVLNEDNSWKFPSWEGGAKTRDSWFDHCLHKLQFNSCVDPSLLLERDGNVLERVIARPFFILEFLTSALENHANRKNKALPSDVEDERANAITPALENAKNRRPLSGYGQDLSNVAKGQGDFVFIPSARKWKAVEMVAPLRRTNSLAPGSRPSNFFLELVLRSRPSKRALSLTGTSGLSVDSKSGLLPW
jgi:hypothetical protein